VTDSGYPRVIYVGGLGRSGSTLVERLLSELPGVRAAGEVVHLWQRGVVEDERCGCGDRFGDCEFWAQVGKTAFGGWDELDVGRVTELRGRVDRTRFIPRLAGAARSAARQPALTEYTGYYLRVYKAIAEVSGLRVVVDSSKHASLAYCLRAGTDLDLRIIHVIRDSRAVAYSWSVPVARPDAARETFMSTYSPVVAAGQWNAQNAAIALLTRTGAPVLRVRYEDLVRCPEETVRSMAGFAGLALDAADLSFLGGDDMSRWASLREAHTVSGNPMRFSTGRIAVRGDERWRTAMPSVHRRTVTALTLPLLTHYGYLRRAA
jgi:Sulfotransferase domain